MIIGIIGKLKSGKTTLANLIKELHPETIELAFGDFLKEMIYKAGLCTREELWGEKTVFSRLMMQKIGTEIIRKQIDENFLVNKVAEKASKIDSKKLIIIHDVRFKNEADMIKLYNGKLYRIIRPSLEQTGEENKHLSETEQDSIVADYEIINDQTLFELRIKAKKILTYQLGIQND